MEETLAKLNAARTRLLEAGVIMMDPNAVYPDEQAVVSKGTVLPRRMVPGSSTVPLPTTACSSG